MLSQRRPLSKSFSGTAPSIERLKDERVSAVRARKQGLALNSSAGRTKLKYDGVGLRRTLSLPDCKEMKLLFKSSPKILANLNGLKRVRSVSFAPEVQLVCAVADNDLDEVKQLLEKYDTDLDHQSASGLAAVHYAALEGSYECLELLVSRGASIDLMDSKGCSPLDFAVRGGHFDCAAYLIKAGAEIKKIVNGLR